MICGIAQDTPAPAKTLTQQDRDFAVASMQRTRKLFLDSVAGLSADQWNFKAGPDRWSIAECAEHIALSEDFISGLAKNQIMKTPATPEKRSEVKVTDQEILDKTPDRSQKFKAPEPIAPKKTFAEPDQAVTHFKDSRDKNIEYIETTQDDLRDHFFTHPAFGPLDAYQWLLLLSAHTERHTLQILEVKADPKFPKS
jgi:uncharacterized damage-inducible protein DinB